MRRPLAGATGIVGTGGAGTADLPRDEQPLPRCRQPRCIRRHAKLAVALGQCQYGPSLRTDDADWSSTRRSRLSRVAGYDCTTGSFAPTSRSDCLSAPTWHLERQSTRRGPRYAESYYIRREPVGRSLPYTGAWPSASGGDAQYVTVTFRVPQADAVPRAAPPAMQRLLRHRDFLQPNSAALQRL
jgi:hypothetical protein